jgi:transposase
LVFDASDIAVNNDSHNDAHNDGRKGDERYRRVEVITGTTRHLRRSEEERARILAESFEPGANVAAVARRHGLNGGLLHYWRKRAKERNGEAAAPPFTPVRIAEASAAAMRGSAPGSASRGRMIEIETAGVRVHVPEGVDAETLSIVLAALRRAS